MEALSVGEPALRYGAINIGCAEMACCVVEALTPRRTVGNHIDQLA
jgi:hypothetical protein